MSGAALRRLLAIYASVLFVVCVGVRTWVVLGPPAPPTVVVSAWKAGKRIARSTDPNAIGTTSAFGTTGDGTTRVTEIAVGEGPLFVAQSYLLFALVPGRDGVKAEIDGKTAYATVDDLLAAQAYDRATSIFDASLGMGTPASVVLHVLAEQLAVTPQDLASRGSFRRVRFERRDEAGRAEAVGASAWPTTRSGTDPDKLDRADVTEAVREAARHLARSVDREGRYRYLVVAPTNVTVPGYNWPRHSGATYFLAQAAALLDDPEIRYACLRAAARLRDDMMKACGANKCIAQEDTADVGSSALALIAFAEIIRTGADASYLPAAKELAAFLRAQQRPDGELRHLYDRRAQKPIDVQLLYYTGEAALALSRMHRVSGDPRDLDAASRALARLSGKGWSFFGSRYYFSEEHWTCQAVADLWSRAPNDEALAFCLRWHEYQRRLQHEDGDSPFDGDGSFGFGPVVSPRVTPASSRGEAAVAALDVLLQREASSGAGGANERELRDVERELRHALAFVMRHQLRPGPTHLFAEPEAIRGALPGSPVDWQLRIDYAQHGGSMMIRWLDVSAHPRYPN